jgi:hypothetical protein
MAIGILTNIGVSIMQLCGIMNRATHVCIRRAFLCLALGAAHAQEANSAAQISYEGTLGPARIGLTVVVKSGAVSGGHYFYAKYLTDLPLTGSIQPGALTLKGQDGGAFALKFVGNGSEAGKPLDFENSVGLEGTWSRDGKSLPVKLTAGGQSPAAASGRWYEMVTDQSDAAFEAKVQGFYKAALAGDRNAAARYVAFPLRVNHNGKSRMIRNATELTAQWEAIFTPAYLAALKKDMPHDLSIVQGQAMLGDGQAFFSDKGATALNIP